MTGHNVPLDMIFSETASPSADQIGSKLIANRFLKTVGIFFRSLAYSVALASVL